MSRNRSALPLRSVEKPRFKVDIMLEALPVRLCDTQFHGLATMVAELERHSRRRQFRHLRPHCTVSAEYVTFFHFAFWLFYITHKITHKIISRQLILCELMFSSVLIIAVII